MTFSVICILVLAVPILIAILAGASPERCTRCGRGCDAAEGAEDPLCALCVNDLS